MEIQIIPLFQVVVEGQQHPLITTTERYVTLDGWIIRQDKIIMSRKLYKHQIDTIEGIYTGIFLDRLNIEKEYLIDIDKRIEYLSSLVGNIEIIENWDFKKH